MKSFRSVRSSRQEKHLRRLRALAEKLKALPHLDEAERLLYARGLLATPDERWMFSRRYVELVDSCRSRVGNRCDFRRHAEELGRVLKPGGLARI